MLFRSHGAAAPLSLITKARVGGTGVRGQHRSLAHAIAFQNRVAGAVLPGLEPDHFESIEEYDNYIKLLVKTNCIDNAKKIWWDLRVHPFFNTVEFRICDIPMTVQETIAIAGLFQAICAKLYKLRTKNLNFMMYNRRLITENKWRASRYGIDGSMIDFGKESEVNTRVLIYELLDFVDDVVPHLGRDRKSVV